VRTHAATCRWRWPWGDGGDRSVSAHQVRTWWCCRSGPSSRRPRTAWPRPCSRLSFRATSHANGRGDHDCHVRMRQRPGAGGARAYYAMARDGLFFARAGVLNKPTCRAGRCWHRDLVAALVLPRTYNPKTHATATCYSNLLDYVISRRCCLYPHHRGRVPAAANASGRGTAVPRGGYPFVPALYMVARPWCWSCCSCTARRLRGPDWRS